LEYWVDGYEDGQNNPFDQDRHRECIFEVCVSGEIDNEGVIQATISEEKSGRLVQVIRSRMYEYQRSSVPAHQQSASSRSSIADEFTKFAKLKEQGAITEE
jgi:hypothetical protein